MLLLPSAIAASAVDEKLLSDRSVFSSTFGEDEMNDFLTLATAEKTQKIPDDVDTEKNGRRKEILRHQFSQC